MLPLALLHVSCSLALIAGFALLVVARALWRGKRAAWALAIALLIGAAVLHLVKGLDWEEASVALALALALVTQRAHFPRRSDPPTLRRLPALLAGGIVLIGLYALVGFAWLAPRLPSFTWSGAAQEFLARIAWSDGPYVALSTGRVGWFLQSLSLLSLTLGSAMLLLLLRPVLARSCPGGDRRHAAELVRSFGTSSLAPFALDVDKQLYFSEAGDGVVTYRVASGVAVVCGDPITAPEAVGALAKEFTRSCSCSAAWSTRTCTLRPSASACMRCWRKGSLSAPSMTRSWQRGRVRRARQAARPDAVDAAVIDLASSTSCREQSPTIAMESLRTMGREWAGLRIGTPSTGLRTEDRFRRWRSR